MFIKKVLIFVTFLSSLKNVKAQSNDALPTLLASGYAQREFVEKDILGELNYFYDAQGLAINKYKGINGHPFLIDEWINSTKIILINNKVINNYKIKLNIHENNLIFTDEDLKIREAKKPLIFEIRFIDIFNNLENYCIKTGFAKVDKQNENSFYLVLAEGKCNLLNYKVKKIIVNHNDMTGQDTKEFVEYDNYYLNVDGKMIPLKRNKQFFINNFTNRSTEIEEYLNSNKINYQRINDIIKLTNYYNSIS